MSATIVEHVTLTFDLEHCVTCGIRFSLPSGFRSDRKHDGGTFYCPNGHAMIYRDREKFEAILASKEQELSSAMAKLRLEQDQKAAAEERLSRLQSRVSKGVCPCCHRTVSQMAKHMAAKHPHWKK